MKKQLLALFTAVLLGVGLMPSSVLAAGGLLIIGAVIWKVKKTAGIGSKLA